MLGRIDAERSEEFAGGLYAGDTAGRRDALLRVFGLVFGCSLVEEVVAGLIVRDLDLIDLDDNHLDGEPDFEFNGHGVGVSLGSIAR